MGAVNRALALGTLGLGLVWLFLPLVTGALTGAPRFFEWDVPEQYWPDLVYLCDQLHQGQLPMWNPFDRGGYPYYADPQSGQYQPVNWAICAIAGPSPAPLWGELRVVLAFFLSGLGGLAWLRGRNTPWLGALPGAMLLMAAPFQRHNWELNLTWAMAALPWMLWAVDRLLREKRLSDAATFALVWAMGAWVGSPPALWFASSFTLLYGLVRLTVQSREDLPRQLGLSVLAGGLGLGLIGAVLVPGLTLAEHSVQQDQSYASIADKALDTEALAALFTPLPGNHLYLGLLTLGMAALALRTRSGRVAALLGALAVGLTLGDHGPVFPLAFRLPGFSMFRLPHRYEAWLGPVGALCWAIGARVLLESPRLPQRLLRAPWLPSLLALVLLFDITRAMPPERHTRAHPHPGGDGEAVLAIADDAGGDWRYYDEFGISCRSGTRLGHRDLRGYQDPLQLKETERVWDALSRSPHLLAWFNVRWVLTGAHFIHGWDRRFLPLPEALEAQGFAPRGEGVLEVPSPLPRAFWTDSWVRAEDRPTALEWLEEHPPGTGLVLDGAVDGHEALQEPGLTDTVPVAAVVRSTHPDVLDIEVDAPGAGWLVVNEAWYPGWQSTVDGEPVATWRGNAMMRAVQVPAGTHRVTMRFLPADGLRWRWILAGSWLATLLLLAGGMLSEYKSRRDRRNP